MSADQWLPIAAYMILWLAILTITLWAFTSATRQHPKGNTLTRPHETNLPPNWDDGTLTDQIRRITTAWTRILVHIGVGRLRKSIQRRVSPTTDTPPHTR